MVLVVISESEASPEILCSGRVPRWPHPQSWPPSAVRTYQDCLHARSGPGFQKFPGAHVRLPVKRDRPAWNHAADVRTASGRETMTAPQMSNTQ